jgi:transposase
MVQRSPVIASSLRFRNTSIKTSGGRLSKCTSRAFVTKVQSELPGQLAESLRPLFEVIEKINVQIAQYEDEVKRTAGERSPETQRLRQIDGVGPITALEYVLTIEDPFRFTNRATLPPI